ncbi:MAG: hypothetical protein KDA38_06860 [Planctomycetales bacterium]|nr:hypothetical protein [Planctomycetales bacterium]
MSLFERPEYRWRETYFVVFPRANRPGRGQVEACLRGLDRRYDITTGRADEEGRFESITLVSPQDFSAMDITYLEGDDVAEQVAELHRELADSVLTDDEQAKWNRLRGCDARFEIFHFEQMMEEDEQEADEYMDPGALLGVLERLAQLCGGVGIDPQSGALM